MTTHHTAYHLDQQRALCGRASWDALSLDPERVECWECRSIAGLPPLNAADERTIRTADGVVCTVGAAAFNYYDMKPGTIGRLDTYPQPDTMAGQDSNTPIAEWSNYWFTFNHDDGTRTSLDGSRICSLAHARRKGWTK